MQRQKLASLVSGNPECVAEIWHGQRRRVKPEEYAGTSNRRITLIIGARDARFSWWFDSNLYQDGRVIGLHRSAMPSFAERLSDPHDFTS